MSNNVRFYYFNLVEQSSTEIFTDNADPSYPSSNLKLPFSSSVYRSTTASENITFDFKTTESVDSILIKPSLEGFGFSGDVTIEANGSADFTTPAFSTTLSVDRANGLGVKHLTTAQSYRFWNISLTGSGYCELANIFIGNSTQLGRNITYNWVFDNNDLSRSVSNRYGQQFIDKISSIKNLSMAIRLMTSSHIDALTDFTDHVATHTPFWVVMDYEENFTFDKDYFAGQFYFVDKPSLSNPYFGLYDTQLRLVECL